MRHFPQQRLANHFSPKVGPLRSHQVLLRRLVNKSFRKLANGQNGRPASGPKPESIRTPVAFTAKVNPCLDDGRSRWLEVGHRQLPPQCKQMSTRTCRGHKPRQLRRARWHDFHHLSSQREVPSRDRHGQSGAISRTKTQNGRDNQLRSLSEPVDNLNSKWRTC